MNKELLLKVKEQILKEPRQFVIRAWYSKHPIDKDGSLWVGVEVPNCGTAACIAGWAIALYDKTSPLHAVGGHQTAAEYLDLHYNEAGELFYHEQWDDDLI